MTDTKPKLIYLWNYAEWGGAQIYMLAIMKRAKEFFDIVVIVPRQSMPDILNFLDRLEIPYEFMDACINGGHAATARAKLRRQLRRIHAEITSFRFLMRYDLKECVLHIEAPPWQSWILLTALAARRANVFVTMHNIMPRAPRWREALWKMRLQFTSRLPGFHIFASNNDTRNQLKGWVADEFWEKLPVTYTAVDPEEINAAAEAKIDVAKMRTNHSLSPGKFLILCVGQFVDRKGRWTFLEAAKLVHEADQNFAFAWLTPKMPDAHDLAMIETYGLGDSFRLVLSSTVGDNRHDVLKFFRVADAFALASFVEGLPIALLEAMALGLPSISTNINAIPEAIKHLDTGILIEAGDARALAAAFETLKTDTGLRESLARNGRRFVLENFDERSVAKIAIDSYNRSLAGK